MENAFISVYIFCRFVVYLHYFLCTKLFPFCFSFVISGMKVYVTDEKELIMEPSIKWAGNPNVTIAVKAFGLKANVQVIHLFPEQGYS